eukprot:UN21942
MPTRDPTTSIPTLLPTLAPTTSMPTLQPSVHPTNAPQKRAGFEMNCDDWLTEFHKVTADTTNLERECEKTETEFSGLNT